VGAALVELLAELGAGQITALDRNMPSGPVTRYLAVDLADQDAVDQAADAVGDPVDVLFANAGVANTQPARTVLAVNFLSVRRLCDRLAPRMRPGSAIVLTSSTAGMQWQAHLADLLELMAVSGWAEAAAWLDGRPGLTGDPYALSKECTQVYTMYAARALGRRGIRINSVCPGPVATPLLADFKATMTEPLLDWAVSQGNGRPATAGEVARILAFLGSDASAYLNGVNLTADAGLTAAVITGQADFTHFPRSDGPVEEQNRGGT
jgi:NAD(P)-dependent dehydrogenase (short-subunit alcohol dehydrogenase family)